MELVLEPGGLVGQHAGRLDHYGQVGDLEGDTLVDSDGSAKCNPCLGVVGRGLEAGLGQSDGEGADRDTSVIQSLKELLEAGARLAEQVLAWHVAVVEGQPVSVGRVPAQLVVGRLDDESLCAGRDQDRTDLGRAVRIVAGTGRDRHNGGDVGATVGDECLGTADNPFVTIEAGLGASGTGVGASLGLCQAKGCQRATGNKIGQPALLLLLGAVGEDWVDAESDTGRQRDADGLVDPAELLDRDAEAREVAVSTPELLRDHEAEQPKVTHLGDQINREMVLAVPCGDVRSHLGLGELPHDSAEVFMILTELEHELMGPSLAPRNGRMLTDTRDDHA